MLARVHANAQRKKSWDTRLRGRHSKQLPQHQVQAHGRLLEPLVEINARALRLHGDVQKETNYLDALSKLAALVQIRLLDYLLRGVYYRQSTILRSCA